jgi:hypothetical protein
VGHAHDDLLDAVARAFLDDLVEDGDDGLAALEREALLADVAGVEEFLEELTRPWKSASRNPLTP